MIDLTGQHFGELIALRFLRYDKNRTSIWLFQCSCGRTKEINSYSVKAGRSKTCGLCCRFNNITGQKFNKLTAIKLISFSKDSSHGAIWLFKCDCGREKIIKANSVLSGSTKACGCLVYNWSGLSDNDRLLNRVVSSYKNRAKNINKIFELSKDSMILLISSPCFYCGRIGSNYLRRKFGKKTLEMRYNGIDRMNSSIGYIKENVVSCCFLCNRMKMKLSVIKFLKHINEIAMYQNKIKVRSYNYARRNNYSAVRRVKKGY